MSLLGTVTAFAETSVSLRYEFIFCDRVKAIIRPSIIIKIRSLDQSIVTLCLFARKSRLDAI